MQTNIKMDAGSWLNRQTSPTIGTSKKICMYFLLLLILTFYKNTKNKKGFCPKIGKHSFQIFLNIPCLCICTFADRPCIDSSRYGDNPTQILKYRHRWQYQKTIIVVMFRPRIATSTPMTQKV